MMPVPLAECHTWDGTNASRQGQAAIQYGGITLYKAVSVEIGAESGIRDWMILQESDSLGGGDGGALCVIESIHCCLTSLRACLGNLSLLSLRVISRSCMHSHKG